MKLYLYTNADSPVSGAYHSGGGVVVITDGDPDQVWLDTYPEERVEYWDDKPEPLGAPDFVCETDSTEERVFVFPDAGCC